MKVLLLLTFLLLGSMGCRGTSVVSQVEALRRVEEKAGELKIPIASREPMIEDTGGFIRFVYPPPPGTRAGSWIFVVDKSTGKFSQIVVER